MHEQRLIELFDELVSKYESSETACINEFSLDVERSENELEKQIIEYRRNFNKALIKITRDDSY